MPFSVAVQYVAYVALYAAPRAARAAAAHAHWHVPLFTLRRGNSDLALPLSSYHVRTLWLHPRLSAEHAMDNAPRAAAVTMGRSAKETPPALPRLVLPSGSGKHTHNPRCAQGLLISKLLQERWRRRRGRASFADSEFFTRAPGTALRQCGVRPWCPTLENATTCYLLDVAQDDGERVRRKAVNGRAPRARACTGTRVAPRRHGARGDGRGAVGGLPRACAAMLTAPDASFGQMGEVLMSVRSRTPVLGTPAGASQTACAAAKTAVLPLQSGSESRALDFIAYGAAPPALDAFIAASKRYQISGFEAALEITNCPILDAFRTALFPALPAGHFITAAWRLLSITLPTAARSAAPLTDLEWTAFLGESMHKVETVSNGCRMSIARIHGLLAPVRGRSGPGAGINTSLGAEPAVPPSGPANVPWAQGRSSFSRTTTTSTPSVLLADVRALQVRSPSHLITFAMEARSDIMHHRPAASRLMQITSPMALFINAKIRSHPLSAWTTAAWSCSRERRRERQQARRRVM
ncbi:hypothetical protein GGX14DRAFT_558851 [Mycena pura]|uniref:Uncharacterized protein n=1 Tax=Mycena pura TaxID=153505 RepID=A0AAD6VX72_9AGAR|nr:hypothetical protein GGX14DRAFT_558851 [Mycena pura]